MPNGEFRRANEMKYFARHAIRSSPFAIRHSALTMVELLIVIIIIGILFGSILVAASSLIGKSKERNTQSVLQVVADAVEEFKREQTARPTITRNAAYGARYGLYPPDELEVFTAVGVPVPSPLPAGVQPTGNLSVPRGSVMFPSEYADAMRFYTDRSDLAADAKEHRDLAAMIVAIESYGDASAALLAKIPDRNRSAGALDRDGKPSQFLDRPEDLNGTTGLGGGFKAEDLQIRYILDDWGMPISYLAQRNYNGVNEDPTRSMNHDGWNKGSTEMIRLNGGQPVIFSYGANGKDQLTKDMMGDSEGKASLMGDFEPAAETAEDKEDVIDNPVNADNVYANPALKEKLAKGIQ
jgi:type II secretory pathway pseudopilin PulG